MTRFGYFGCLFGMVVALVACGDDASPTDSGVADSGTDAGILLPPTLTAPVAGAMVFGSIEVTGTAAANAAVQVLVLQGTAAVGTGSGVANGTGGFSVTVSYSGPTNNDALTVSVTQTAGGRTSDAAEVSVTHSAPSTLSGMVSQVGGSSSGTEVTIYAYVSNMPQDLAFPVASTTLVAEDDTALPPTAFTLEVADGDYYLRAFRDSDVEDGLPTMGEPQAPLSAMISVSGASTGTTLELDAPASSDRFSRINAYGFVETAEPFPPQGDGEGLCGGASVRLEGEASGTALSTLWVRTATGEVVELLDDGGCGSSVRDNRTQSYDREAGDGFFSYGLPNPAEDAAGQYRFFYQQTDDDHIEIRVDSLDIVRELSLVRILTAPSTVTTLTDRTPTVEWADVPNADQYFVQIRESGPGGTDVSSGPLSNASFTVPADLDDDRCYALSIVAEEFGAAEDVDARSESGPLGFCVDSGGDSSIVVSGAISNTSGANGAYGIRVETENGNRVTVRLPATATTYAVGILADGTGGGAVSAFIDVDASGDPDTRSNRNLRGGSQFADASNDATVDVIFRPSPMLTTPAAGATVSAATPNFGWNDFATTAGAEAPENFVVALFISDQQGDGFPETIVAMPGTATAYDLASPPTATAAVDVVFIAECGDGGGTYALDASGNPSCSGASPTGSATTLMPATDYGWGVVVIECTYPDFSNTTERETFGACVAASVMNEDFFSLSESRFRTL